MKADHEMQYPHVVGAFFDQKWAMMPESLQRYYTVVNQWSLGVRMDRDAVREMMDDKESRAKQIRRVEGKVAVLPVFGVISQRASLMAELSSGGTSTERIGRELDAALKDQDVEAIVLNIDSPGGSVYGVQELADKIHAARGQKPLYAIANSLAASAAYHIGAAADQFYVTPSGEVGSIGVYSLHVDQSGWNEQTGIAVTYISAGKYKVEGNPDMPLDEEALEAIQQSVNGYYDTFVANVAKFRNVAEKDVRNGFGQGRVVAAEQAKREKMVDRVMSFEQLMSELGAKPQGKRASAMTAEQARAVRRRRDLTSSTNSAQWDQ